MSALLVMMLSLGPASLLPGKESPSAGKGAVKLYLFWGKGCPHCDKERTFLKTLKQKYPKLEIKEYEIWYDKKNKELFSKIVKAAKLRSAGVPATIIGTKMFTGFTGQTAKGMEDAIAACIKQGCADTEAVIQNLSSQQIQEEQKTVTIPLLGEMDPAKMSLPVFTVVLGGLDSFNPCAFFVLLFLLSLLIHARSRARMLLIGGIFVLFSGIIYFLFMAAWLNIFMIIGQLTAITVTAGIIAVAVAGINIKDFFFFKKGVSLAIPEKAKPRLFERMRNLLKSPTLPAMITGTVVLAITANAYELLCTAGFPMVYTRVLTLHKLAPLQYYLYLVLYNTVYVIPLAIIVIVITATLGAKKMTEWQGRQLKLISGLMMLLLGLILLIDPALLNNVLATVALLAAVLVLSAIAISVTKRLRPEITSE